MPPSSTLPLLDRARSHGNEPAITDGDTVVSHAQLLDLAQAIAVTLLEDQVDLAGARVAYLLPPGAVGVATLWGIWLAGGTAVPLALSHPGPELRHTMTDSGSTIMVTDASLGERAQTVLVELPARLVMVPQEPSTTEFTAVKGAALPNVPADRDALIVYTSGSTGRPKGAVWTHVALAQQVTTLHQAWDYQPDDVALLVLPLHHVHGLINVVLTTLWTGGCIRVMPQLDPIAVWESMGDLTVLMAVPTIYHKLLTAYDAADVRWQQQVAEAASGLRLMISGSAALPVSVLDRWKAITGHVLLERYGMTEIGMALSNPYEGPRIAGSVGRPLPGVDVRVVDERGRDVTDGQEGGLLVRSDAMFRAYWQRPEATEAAFVDGWFVTGDVVTRDPEGVFRIRGRESVDIIKSGGFKVSALEVEEVLRTYPGVVDCAVVGLPDEEWGQVVGAAVVTSGTLGGLTDWMRERVATYKIPRQVVQVQVLPRNALGKVVKPRIVDEVFGGCALK